VKIEKGKKQSFHYMFLDKEEMCITKRSNHVIEETFRKVTLLYAGINRHVTLKAKAQDKLNPEITETTYEAHH